MFDAPDRQLVGVAGVARVRGVALPVLDGEPVLDLMLLGVIQPDAEDVGVDELVDALVERAGDRIDVERRGELAANGGQPLDVLLAFGLRPGERFGCLGAQPRLGELGALTLLAGHLAALDPIDGEDEQSGEQAGIRRTPTRCDTTAAGW